MSGLNKRGLTSLTVFNISPQINLMIRRRNENDKTYLNYINKRFFVNQLLHIYVEKLITFH